ncbi:UNVERIFIED_CONTAM: hypothetical protein HHA_242080 [Hammondia hammondi]|eukprot:XP_008884440.1 hypothetical protein HHA_242080 [Hammondia hammondi]
MLLNTDKVPFLSPTACASTPLTVVDSLCARLSLQQLETEARTSPNSQALLQVVRRYQSDFEQARSVFTRLVQQWQRQQLLQGPGPRRGQDTQRTRSPRSAESPFSSASTADSGNHSFDASDADEKALAVHHAGGTLLGESNRLAIESEHVGLAVMGQLRTQRESLISSRSLAQKTHGELQDSRSLLTAMLRQSLFSKLILVAIIVFLSLAIVCVLIHRLLRLEAGKRTTVKCHHFSGPARETPNLFTVWLPRRVSPFVEGVAADCEDSNRLHFSKLGLLVWVLLCQTHLTS